MSRSRSRSNRRQVTPPRIPERSEKRLGVLGYAGRLIVGLSTVFGLITGIQYFRCNLAIEPDFSINPTKPLSTEFRFKNASQFTLYNVRFSCRILALEAPGFSMRNSHLHDLDTLPPADQIASGESATRVCPFDLLFGGPAMTGFTKANLLVEASYRPSFSPFRTGSLEHFVGVLDSSGIVHWSHEPSPR